MPPGRRAGGRARSEDPLPTSFRPSLPRPSAYVFPCGIYPQGSPRVPHTPPGKLSDRLCLASRARIQLELKATHFEAEEIWFDAETNHVRRAGRGERPWSTPSGGRLAPPPSEEQQAPWTR